MIARIVLYIVAALLLGAHYYRSGDLLPVAACVAVPFLFFWRQRPALWALQVFAYAGAVVWIVAALRLVAVRQQAGQPWTVAAIILGSVAAFTAVAGLLLNGRAPADRYPR
jgi:hypothetical protein